ncbi:hypothetical protein HBI67_065840 [Parastagonospora nodorum]|nr:hypothetical protein HBI79_047310 [Parastagonospora nodorum]KAH6074364.1 hypothetical protein HBI67_065840 [Parastagonospora nodorum]KAH6088333.1 hypothetical protein HBI66_031540 [Parastagonospora nodorum]
MSVYGHEASSAFKEALQQMCVEEMIALTQKVKHDSVKFTVDKLLQMEEAAWEARNAIVSALNLGSIQLAEALEKLDRHDKAQMVNRVSTVIGHAYEADVELEVATKLRGELDFLGPQKEYEEEMRKEKSG